MSDRLRDALASADVIYAEDTRRTAKLLGHIGVSTPLRSLFVGNEAARTEELIRQVADGREVVLVSDAGTPAISDPGADAISGVRERGLPVTVVPGPSAVTAAVAASGFGGDRFVFEGFLPRRGKERAARIQAVASEERVVVIFASPHRLRQDLEELRDVCGEDREIAVNRELTKLHEEIWVGRLGEAPDRFDDPVKGEVTLVLGRRLGPSPSLDEAIRAAVSMVESGSSVSDAARLVATEHGVSRREVYQALVGLQDSS